MTSVTAAADNGQKKRGSGLTKEVKLSKDLAALVGSDKMPRYEIIKRIWQIIRSRQLQDPTNKQFIVLKDADMKVVFSEAGTDRIKAFSMMKYLKSHITPL